jgi:hypothetical protein
MKKIIVAVSALMFTLPSLACNPVGWQLIEQRKISISETLCVYEKSGVRVSIMVSGFCPFHPC